jgi:hypothetical protein
MRAAPTAASAAVRVIARKSWRADIAIALVLATKVADQGEYRVNLM